MAQRLEEQQRGQRVAQAGKGKLLQPHLSIEGREGAGLFLQEGEELWLWETVAKNTPRARGEQEVTWERKSQVLVALGQRWHCHKCGTAAPPQPLQGRVFRAPTGQNWGVPEPQPALFCASVLGSELSSLAGRLGLAQSLFVGIRTRFGGQQLSAGGSDYHINIGIVQGMEISTPSGCPELRQGLSCPQSLVTNTKNILDMKYLCPSHPRDLPRGIHLLTGSSPWHQILVGCSHWQLFIHPQPG